VPRWRDTSPYSSDPIPANGNLMAATASPCVQSDLEAVLVSPRSVERLREGQGGRVASVLLPWCAAVSTVPHAVLGEQVEAFHVTEAMLFAFDLLELDGVDYRQLPLRERKAPKPLGRSQARRHRHGRPHRSRISPAGPGAG
jgi:hypothetical protein